jgi:hypothetical protein
MKNAGTVILAIIVLVAFALTAYIGYTTYPKLRPCPEASVDTVFVWDTVTYLIPDTIPYYIVGKDSIVYDTIPSVVDTAAILKQFYAKYYYTRTWTDSLLTVTLKDVISQNTPIENAFTYKILRPQTLITNVTNNYSYGRYITAGVDVPLRNIKYLNIEAMYVTGKWYAGVGYNAAQNTPTIKGGLTLYRFK